ncbi:hypothetical protein LZ838_06130 [Pseudomonas sp. AA27]|uniref:hypothetical protein n=1 Tax=Pseudomonas sp. AA27 TaxID=2908652 RepID=UPI001F334E9B|nr:hypothetical protein [Pseudomonas sp. AA27]MCF1486932.1 hypothetical protein [Pseudomonas sp. AA27]
MDEPEPLNIVIRSEAQAFEYLARAQAGEFEGEEVLLSFSGWPVLDINVKGDRYHSTIPAGIMKGLVEYQGALNKAFALVSNSDTSKSLTDDNRKALDVTFEVKEGSSDIKSDIAKQLGVIAQQAMGHMSGTEIVLTVLGIAIIASLTYLGATKIRTTGESAAEKQRLDFAKEVVESNVKLAQINKEVTESALSVIKGAHDAEILKLGKSVLTRTDIEFLNRRTRSLSDKRRIDDSFHVIKLHTTDQKWKLILEHPVYGQIKVDLYKGEEAGKVLDEIQTAFRQEKTVKLYMVALFKEETVVSASIVGTPTLGLLYEDE